MTTTPGWTICIVVILITTVATVSVLVIVRQREQEVIAVTGVARAIPVGYRVTTNQSLSALTSVQSRDGYRRSFAIATAVEG